ncbi:MAG: response regulator transcription factor [Rhodoluna sp.]|nr:response regulator transcription factor [Rhodoluna sp.]MBP6186803.1 response regulator transcription factor [Rhodoluna sp.]
MGWKFLIVEDDRSILETVQAALQLKGHEVVTCEDGSLAMDVFRKSKPDLVILDWMLPGKDGIEILKEIVAESSVPVVMASARTDEEEVSLALDKFGAADYAFKPYNTAELVLRATRLLKLVERNESDNVQIGPIAIDVSAYEVSRGGSKISLTPLEFNLLLTIAEDPKHTFTREELLKKVWLHKNLGDETDFKGKVDTRLVNVHIQRLRSKIEENPDDPQIVTTVRGRGYKAGAF